MSEEPWEVTWREKVAFAKRASLWVQAGWVLIGGIAVPLVAWAISWGLERPFGLGDAVLWFAAGAVVTLISTALVWGATVFHRAPIAILKDRVQQAAPHLIAASAPRLVELKMIKGAGEGAPTIGVMSLVDTPSMCAQVFAHASEPGVLPSNYPCTLPWRDGTYRKAMAVGQLEVMTVADLTRNGLRHPCDPVSGNPQEGHGHGVAVIPDKKNAYGVTQVRYYEFLLRFFATGAKAPQDVWIQVRTTRINGGLMGAGADVLPNGPTVFAPRA